MEPTTTPTQGVPEPGTPGAQTFTCIVQPASAAACAKDEGPQGWLDSILGVSWAFATLVIVALLLLFGPRGKLGGLMDALSQFIARLNSAKFGDVTLSAEAAAALKESTDTRVAGATPVLAEEAREAESEAEKALIQRLLEKDFACVPIGDYPYLLHEGSRTPDAQYDFAARVYIEFWTQNKQRPQRGDVEKVYYRVDDSFPQKWWVMSGEDARRGFQVVLRINGEFTVVAVVKYKSGETVWLTRYLELPGRPTT